MKFPRSDRCSWRRPVVVVALVLSFTVAGVFAQRPGKKNKLGVKFHSVKSYAHRAEAAPAAGTGTGKSGGKGGAREYVSHFRKSATCYIAVQVVFENLRHGEDEFEYEVTMGLYTFDNQLISAHKEKMVVAADWKYAWASQSYGWAEAGRWSVGTYRVKVWLGEEKVGEAAIYVDDDTKGLPPSVAAIEVRGL